MSKKGLSVGFRSMGVSLNSFSVLVNKMSRPLLSSITILSRLTLRIAGFSTKGYRLGLTTTSGWSSLLKVIKTSDHCRYWGVP
jgi:hypothetical protein